MVFTWSLTSRPVFTVFACFQSFGRIQRWLEHARTSPSLKVLAGGTCDDSKGYFVEPTIVETTDPQDAIMCEVCVTACECGCVLWTAGGPLDLWLVQV